MTIIEIRPHGNGWKVFEAPGVEPVFPKKEQAIGYAETRACCFFVIHRSSAALLPFRNSNTAVTVKARCIARGKKGGWFKSTSLQTIEIPLFRTGDGGRKANSGRRSAVARSTNPEVSYRFGSVRM